MKPSEIFSDSVRRLGGASLDFEQSFAVAKNARRLLDEVDTEDKGRELVIRVLDAWEKIPPTTHELWNDLVAAAGLYPYVRQENLSARGQLRLETHASPFLEGIYFTEGQLSLSTMLAESMSVVVSAPTSFGKSLLIEEVVASKKYKNIVIIQPTLALLDETRKKLQRYRDHYHIVVSTFQKPGNGPNIFLFTGERVVEYPEFPPVDFFVIDEFYKLSLKRDDERAATLNCALYRLLKFTKRFYFLGPNIKEMPKGLPAEINAQWVKTDFSTVAVNRHPIKIEATGKKQWLVEAQPKLNALLRRLDESTLIYCQSPNRAVNLTAGMAGTLNSSPLTSNAEVLAIIQWVRENIHHQWGLISALERGLAYHHGSLPRHLGSALVDAFNSKAISRLFCTSTLIEGVNTAAKNVVLFDRLKGLKAIDYFDHKNIVGRSGRMNRHFIGNVYEFHPEPKQVELEVEVPLFMQEEAPAELLVQLDPRDVQALAKEKLRKFQELPNDAQVVIKRNKGLPVDGQIEIIEILRKQTAGERALFQWSGIPNYPQLAAVLSVAWKHLLKPGESKGGALSPGNLAVLTLQYCASRTIGGLIRQTAESGYWIEREPNDEKRINTAVNMVLQVSRHWFEYKLPKFLSAVHYLQEYVNNDEGKRPGNYLVLAQMIESHFLPSNLAALLEYDIPASALRKMAGMVNPNMSPEEVLAQIRTMDFRRTRLLPYEEQKLRAVGE